MYTEDNEGHVVITLDHKDYSLLVMALGYAMGTAVKINEQPMAQSFMKLANTINEGNPNWLPYETHT